MVGGEEVLNELEMNWWIKYDFFILVFYNKNIDE